MNKLGIDVKTKTAKKLIARLSTLKTTVKVDGPFEYWQDRNYSQILIDTEWTESQLDDWLYKTKHGCEYIGTFERQKA